MIRIRAAANGRLQHLTVLQHTIHFAPDGFADGSELSPAEIERLRRFHFLIEEVPDLALETSATAQLDPHTEPEGDEPVVLLTEEDEDTEEATETIPAKKAARGRRATKNEVN